MDEETGLYNFRARLYDDELGIFYATDPAGQTFSPFGYAGNNPVIFVDKDGRFWEIFAIVVAAWLSGSAANDWQFNPIKWDWQNPSTYIWTIGGGLGGWATYGALASGSLNLGFTTKWLSAAGKEIASLGLTLSEVGTSMMYLSSASIGLYGANLSYNRIKSTINDFPQLTPGSEDLINDPTERNLITFGYSISAAAFVGANAEAGIVFDWDTGESIPYFNWGYTGGIGYSGGPKAGYMRTSFKDFYGSGSQNIVPYNSEEFGFDTRFGGLSFYWDPRSKGRDGDIFGFSLSIPVPKTSFGMGLFNNYTNQTFVAPSFNLYETLNQIKYYILNLR